MTTAHDNNATSWRDLADQLTEQQRATLARFEHDEDMPAEMLLNFARDHIEARLTDIAYADVPIPPGDPSVGKWELNTAGGWSRSLLWAEFGEPEMSIDIDGTQQHDGTYTRLISVYLIEDGASLTTAGARKLASLLVEAADELDRLGAEVLGL